MFNNLYVKVSIEFLRGFAIIIFFLALGKIVSFYSPFVFPASIIGLLLLFMALVLKLVKVEWVLLTGNVALKYMVLLFIPIGVGLIDYLSLIAENYVAILASLFITTLLILFTVGHVFQYLDKEK